MLVIMTTSEDRINEKDNPTQYVINYEKDNSLYRGSFINYDTLVLINKVELTKLLQSSYRKREIISPLQKLNERDFKEFQNKQKIYFADHYRSKYLTLFIYSFDFLKKES